MAKKRSNFLKNKKLKTALKRIEIANKINDVTEIKRQVQTINHLLNLVQENQERKNRSYGLISLLSSNTSDLLDEILEKRKILSY